MADLSGLPAKIRALLQLTSNLIDICYDCRSGLRSNPVNEDLDIEQTSDQLSELRDVLEKLFKAATAGVHSPGSGLSAAVVDELLLKCRSEIGEMETTLKQESGRKRIKGLSSSLDANMILTNVASSTTALRGAMDARRWPSTWSAEADSVISVNNFIDSRNGTTYNVAGDQNTYNFPASGDSDHPSRKEVCAWLSAPDPSSNQNDAIKKRGPETGLWFIDGKVYKEWKVGSRSFIWVYGIPGSGKSVLCSTVIEDIAGYCQDNPSFALAYHYFDFTDPNKQKSSALIRSFLTQLSFAFTGCPDVLAKLHAQCHDGQQQPTTVDLMCSLKNVIEGIPNVYLVVDALDECSEREDLLGILTEVANWGLHNLHILATSRRERDIEDGINQIISVHVELESDTVDADIRIYLSTKLVKDPRFKIWTADERREIEDGLMQRAQGMFRLVTCQLDLLAKCSSLHKLRKALGTLPKTLEDTYDRILINIGEEQSDDAVKLLQWLAFSARPLFLAEMAEIFAIDRNESTPQFDPDQRPREPRDILDICSSLVVISHNTPYVNGYSDRLRDVPVSVYDSGMLSLAHLSVKEYLTSGKIKDPSISCYHLSRKIADTALSQECLAYLLQFTTVNCLRSCDAATSSFGRYAAEFWMLHARSVDDLIPHEVHPLISSLFLSRNSTFSNWVTLFDIDRGGRPLNWRDRVPHPLYYASLMGLNQIVDQIVLTGNKEVINSYGGSYGSALASATAQGHKEIVQFLLKSGAEVNLTRADIPFFSKPDGTALVSASVGGHEEIVRILLDSGADINLAGSCGDSALASASAGGHEAIVQLLLDSGADINFAGGIRGSALASASRQGHKGAVQLLLKSGVDVDLAGGLGGSALASASAGGHEEIIQILLDSGADINSVADLRGSALASASGQGHKGTVQLLLKSGADINLAGGGWGSALASASAKGHEEVVRLLLDNGADVNSGEDYESALASASAGGHEEIVRLLLDNRADANLAGGYRSALALASAEGHLEIVRLLLDSGADVNLAGGDYGSALASASYEGQEEIVQLLLKSGAEINLAGGEYGSALASASAGGYEDVVQLLLDAGAEINLAGGEYGSALASASAEGYEDVVQLLLDSGAEINLAGGEYGSALASASAEGHEAIVRLLLDSGADINLVGELGESALTSASEQGHEEVARLPLDRGADIDLEGGELGSALASDSEHGHEEVDQLPLASRVVASLKDKSGWSALMWAISSTSRWSESDMKVRSNIIKLLLERGADANVKDKYGWSALVLATVCCHPVTAQLVRDYCAGDISDADASFIEDYYQYRRNL